MNTSASIILEMLEKRGLGVDMNLAPIMNEIYEIKNKKDYSEVQSIGYPVQSLIKSLDQDGLIKLRPGAFDGFLVGNSTEGYRWFNDIFIYASIT